MINHLNTGRKHKMRVFHREISIKTQEKLTLLFRIMGLPLYFIYEEIIFHAFVFGGNFTSIIYPVLYAVFFGACAALVTGLFPYKVNRACMWLITGMGALWYSAQIVYQYIFKTFLSVYSVVQNGADAMEFYEQALKAIWVKSFQVLLLFLPFILFLVLSFRKKELWSRDGKTCMLLKLSTAAAGLILFLLSLLISGRNLHSAYELYHKNFIMDLSMERLGVLPSTGKDLVQTLLAGVSGKEEEYLFIETPSEALSTLLPTPTPSPVPTLLPTPVPQLTKTPQETTEEQNKDMGEQKSTPTPTLSPTPSPSPTPTPIDTSPNVLPIDFSKLAGEEENKKIQNLHKYFASAVPTNKNEYTGMFEGYNLIMITAEGYSKWAVNEEITPTLYKMAKTGFVFENYYTPLWWTSTSDGEFVECTGLIPTGTNSFTRTATHYMPFGFGWVFGGLGYSSRAYHNHTYTYYHRDQTHPNMGYDYKGYGNGLDVKKTWPESDLEMMEKTIPEYIRDEKFHAYYMTVSGHMEYTFGGNSMSKKNKSYVEHLPLSTEAKAYLACQKELDLAMEYLLEQLEVAGVADKTVIVLSGDHYPYGLEKNKIDELAGHKVEENFELYESELIIYCPGMEETITVSKPCSALDIVPTVLNLFGIDYDSRLFMGQDIFSTAAPLVMFSNQSFITDRVMYNSKNGVVTKLVEEELPENYIKTVSAIVKNKFNVSATIIKDDYYSYLKDELERIQNE